LTGEVRIFIGKRFDMN